MAITGLEAFLGQLVKDGRLCWYATGTRMLQEKLEDYACYSAALLALYG